MDMYEPGSKSHGKAMRIDPHQGGSKDAERPGANDGIVDHHKVDMIDHAAQHTRVKHAMSEHGHENVHYFDGGLR